MPFAKLEPEAARVGARVTSARAAATRTIGPCARTEERRAANQVRAARPTPTQGAPPCAHGAAPVPFPPTGRARVWPLATVVAAGG